MSGGFVHLVGIGPGDEASISVGALAAIRNATEIWSSDIGHLNSERLFLRPYLRGKKLVNLAPYYSQIGIQRKRMYRMIAGRLVHLAGCGRQITYLLSGNPFVWVYITDLLKDHAAAGRLNLRITPSMSFLDTIWHDIPFSCRGNLQLRLTHIGDPDISPHIDCVVGQVGDVGVTGFGGDSQGNGLDKLSRLYPPEHEVFVSGYSLVYATQHTERARIADLSKVLPNFAPSFYVVIIPKLP